MEPIQRILAQLLYLREGCSSVATVIQNAGDKLSVFHFLAPDRITECGLTCGAFSVRLKPFDLQAYYKGFEHTLNFRNLRATKRSSLVSWAL